VAAQIFEEKCNGCGWCINVCPHQIILLTEEKKAIIFEEDRCIECGACSLQCPSEAILAHPLGCGCVTGVLRSKIRRFFRREPKAVSC
jgi:ferredoxin